MPGTNLHVLSPAREASPEPEQASQRQLSSCVPHQPFFPGDPRWMPVWAHVPPFWHLSSETVRVTQWFSKVPISSSRKSVDPDPVWSPGALRIPCPLPPSKGIILGESPQEHSLKHKCFGSVSSSTTITGLWLREVTGQCSRACHQALCTGSASPGKPAWLGPVSQLPCSRLRLWPPEA